MKTWNVWFSIIEVIITVSILVILWVVAVTSYDATIDKTKNTKVESHLQTLKNSFVTYFDDTKELPFPEWNLKFYNIDGVYEHNYEDENTFWVSGYITEKVMPKKYMADIPLDPRNNQYYWFAKTKKYNWFQIAGVVVNHNEPKAKLFSHWEWAQYDTWVYGAYLVKEYNGPRFIIDNSSENFPYNPKEMLLTAKVHKTSGNIKINDKSVTQEQALNYTLVEWDKIEIEAGKYIDIYYSDGSYSSLWDQAERSQIQFKEMRYIEENNLFTSIKIALNMGSLWSKATKLADKSDFQVETPNAVAAVRGTIFWLRQSGSTTSIVLKEGKLQLFLKKADILKPLANYNWVTDENWYIEVAKWADAEWVEVIGQGSTGRSSSAVVDYLTNQKMIPSKKSEFLEYIPPTQKEVKVWAQNECQTWYEKWGDECVEFVYEDDYDIWQSSTDTKIVQLYKDVLQRYPTKDELYDYCERKVEGHAYSYWVDDSIISRTASEIASILQGQYPGKVNMDTFSWAISFIWSNEKDGSGFISNPLRFIGAGSDWIKVAVCNFREIFTLSGTVLPSSLKNNQFHTGAFLSQAYHNYLNKKEKYFNPDYICDAQNSFKVDYECIENTLLQDDPKWEVVAYAPFDENVEMWTGTILNTNTSSGLSFSWKYNNSDLYFTDLVGPSCQGSTKQPFANENDWLIALSPKHLIPNFQIYHLWDTKWVFLDNLNCDDYLRYHISPLSLSWSSFAIEMNVRGWALTRTGSGMNYFLYQLWDSFLNLRDTVGKMILKIVDEPVIDGTRLGQLNLDNEAFYKVIAEYAHSLSWNTSIYTPKLSIYNKENQVLISTGATTGTGISALNNIYIGAELSTNSQYKNQWNDIIDYVKIYKKIR